MTFSINKAELVSDSRANPQEEEFEPINKFRLDCLLEKIENEVNQSLNAKDTEIKRLSNEILDLRAEIETKLLLLNDSLIQVGNRETHKEKDEALFKSLQLLVNFRSKKLAYHGESEF